MAEPVRKKKNSFLSFIRNLFSLKKEKQDGVVLQYHHESSDIEVATVATTYIKPSTDEETSRNISPPKSKNISEDSTACCATPKPLIITSREPTQPAHSPIDWEIVTLSDITNAFEPAELYRPPSLRHYVSEKFSPTPNELADSLLTFNQVNDTIAPAIAGFSSIRDSKGFSEQNWRESSLVHGDPTPLSDDPTCAPQSSPVIRELDLQSHVDTSSSVKPLEIPLSLPGTGKIDLRSFEFAHHSHCLQFVHLMQVANFQINHYWVRSLPESEFLEIICSVCLTRIENVYTLRKHTREVEHRENFKRNKKSTVLSPKVTKCFWEFLRYSKDCDYLVCILCDEALMDETTSWFDHFESKSHKSNLKELNTTDSCISKQNNIASGNESTVPCSESQDGTLPSRSSSPVDVTNASSIQNNADRVCDTAAENLIKSEFDYLKLLQYTHCQPFLKYLQEVSTQINCFSFECKAYVDPKVFCKLCCKKMTSPPDAGKHIQDKLHLYILTKKRTEGYFQPCLPANHQENWKWLCEYPSSRLFLCTLCNQKLKLEWFPGAKASTFIIACIAHFENQPHKKLRAVDAQAAAGPENFSDDVTCNDPAIQSFSAAPNVCKTDLLIQNRANDVQNIEPENQRHQKLQAVNAQAADLENFTDDVLYDDPVIQSFSAAPNVCKTDLLIQNRFDVLQNIEPENQPHKKLQAVNAEAADHENFTDDVLYDDPVIQSFSAIPNACKTDLSIQNSSNVLPNVELTKNYNAPTLSHKHSTLNVQNTYPLTQSINLVQNESGFNSSTVNSSNTFDCSDSGKDAQEDLSIDVENNVTSSQLLNIVLDKSKTSSSTHNSSDTFYNLKLKKKPKSMASPIFRHLKRELKELKLQRYSHCHQFLGYLRAAGDQINCLSFESYSDKESITVSCKLCEKEILNSRDAGNHIKDETHLQSVRVQRSRGLFKPCNLPFTEESRRTIIPHSVSHSFYCLLCRKLLTFCKWRNGLAAASLIVWWIEHLESLSHIAKVEEDDIQPRKGGENFSADGNSLSAEQDDSKTFRPSESVSCSTLKAPAPLNLFQDSTFELEGLRFDKTSHKEQFENLANEINYQINFFSVEVRKGSKQLHLLCKLCDQLMLVSKVKLHTVDQNHLKNIANLSRSDDRMDNMTEPSPESWSFLDFDSNTQDFLCSLCEMKLSNSRNLWIDHFNSVGHCEKQQASKNAANKTKKEENRDSSPVALAGKDIELPVTPSPLNTMKQPNSKRTEETRKNGNSQVNSSNQPTAVFHNPKGAINCYETILSELKNEKQLFDLSGIFKFIKVDEEYFTACDKLGRAKKRLLMLNSRFILMDEEKPDEVFCTACHCFSDVRNNVSSLENLIGHFKGSQHKTQSEYLGSAADFHKNIPLVSFYEHGNGYCNLCKKFLPRCKPMDVDSLLDHFESPEHVGKMRSLFEGKDPANETDVLQYRATLFLNQKRTNQHSKQKKEAQKSQKNENPLVNSNCRPTEIFYNSKDSIKCYETIISELEREKKLFDLTGIFKFIKIDQDYFTACQDLNRAQRWLLMLNSRFLLINEENPGEVFCTACHCFNTIKNDVSSLQNLIGHFKGSQHRTQSEYFGSAADLHKNIPLISFYKHGNGFCNLCKKLLLHCEPTDIDSLLDHFDSSEHVGMMRSIFKGKESTDLKAVSKYRATLFLRQNPSKS